MDAKEFGRFIAGVRKSNNITQVELAKKLNVTDKAVSRWERGLGFPDINTLEPLADALGLSVVELMQSKRNDDTKLISTEKAEEMLIDAIELSKAPRKAVRVTGACVLILLSVLAVCLIGLLILDWNVLSLIVPGIILALIAWAVPVWEMTIYKGSFSPIPAIVSFGSALLALLFRILDIAHNINTNDVVAVIDTIDSEVIIVSIFIAVTLALNLCSTTIVRKK